MSLQHQQISDSIDIIHCSYLENSVTVLHRFDALENSNSFVFFFFLDLACLVLTDFFLTIFGCTVRTLISY